MASDIDTLAQRRVSACALLPETHADMYLKDSWVCRPCKENPKGLSDEGGHFLAVTPAAGHTGAVFTGLGWAAAHQQ